LDVGESVYRFRPRIRKAIEVRDAHCTFGACTAPPPWCQAHHLVPFGRNGRPGGPTAEANGTLLCGSHHRFVHANGWTGSLIEGQVHWRPPPPGAPPGEREGQGNVNAANRQFETKLRQLALRWLTRNPNLRNPG
jgi:HNH endonuclease